MDNENEKLAKKCGSMKELRQHTSLKEPWANSVKVPVQTITSRFKRLVIKDESIDVIPSMSDAQIGNIKQLASFLT